MAYKDVTPPAGGKISILNGKLTVPANPILPFIRGDGTGPDIWAASVRVFGAAVLKAYGGNRKISWFEVFAGEAAKNKFDNWLPDDTVEAFKDYLVGIKGPLTTPVGGGIRSLNVALRQMLDLYVCLRPVQWFTGVPSPVKHPEKVNMVIFRENTEDIYAGIDFEAGKEAALKTIEFLKTNFPKDFKKIRFGSEAPEMVGIGIKPVSKTGTQRLVRSALQYAIAQKKKSVTIVHKGNIMKYTEGAFRDWSYELAKTEFCAVEMDGGPWCKIPEGKPGAGLVIKDAIADITLQQVLTRPTDFDVIATLESERRLFERCAGGASRRHRHRARRQHQLYHRPRDFRSHARHRAEICEQGRGQPRLGRVERRNDVPLPGLDGSGGFDFERLERRDWQQARHLRLCAPDGRCNGNQMLAVRRQHHFAHVKQDRHLACLIL